MVAQVVLARALEAPTEVTVALVYPSQSTAQHASTDLVVEVGHRVLLEVPQEPTEVTVEPTLTEPQRQPTSVVEQVAVPTTGPAEARVDQAGLLSVTRFRDPILDVWN